MTAAATMQTACSRIERVLRDRGYGHPDVRRLVCAQLLLASVSTLAVLAFSGLSVFGWSYAAGAVLATLNFLSLAKFVQHLVYVEKGAVVALLIRFYGRLIVTGIALYGLIAWAGASVVALLAGLSTVVATGIFWGLARMSGHNVKEA